MRTSSRVVAEKRLQDIETKIAAGGGDWRNTASRSLREAFDDFLASSTRERTTLSRYRTGFDLACAYFGAQRPLSTITRGDAQAFAKSLQLKPDGTHRALSTLKNLNAGIRQVFQEAVDSEEIRENPWVVARVIRRLVPKRDLIEEDDELVIPFTRAEQRKLLEHLQPRDPGMHIAAVLGLRCGLRRSEVLALHWDDVDLESTPPMLHVRRRVAAGRAGPVKSKTSRRRVPLTEESVAALRAYRTTLRAEAMKRGGQDLRPAVIPGHRPGTGASYREIGRFSKAFRKMLVEAKIDLRTEHPFHRLRHTYCSELLSMGVDVDRVSRWAGHQTPAITKRHYEHFIPNPDDAKLVNQLDQGIAGDSLTGDTEERHFRLKEPSQFGTHTSQSERKRS